MEHPPIRQNIGKVSVIYSHLIQIIGYQLNQREFTDAIADSDISYITTNGLKTYEFAFWLSSRKQEN